MQEEVGQRDSTLRSQTCKGDRSTRTLAWESDRTGRGHDPQAGRGELGLGGRGQGPHSCLGTVPDSASNFGIGLECLSLASRASLTGLQALGLPTAVGVTVGV